MIVRLVHPNLQETITELPLRSFSTENTLKKHEYKVDNYFLKASFSEIRTPHICAIDTNVLCSDSVKMYLQAEEHGCICFCAALRGSVTSTYEPFGYKEKWLEGKANLLSFEGLNSTCFWVNKPFRMREIMLSGKYLEELTGKYPELMKNVAVQHMQDGRFKAFKENKVFCPKIALALNNIFHSAVDGSSEEMYIDAKIREILSLFLCRNKQKDCSGCSCFSSKDNDLFIRVKEIIEKEYVNPPSLRQLALMVGTNECKLKNGFKSLFGTTVFGHLFEYRMEMACRLLLDSGTSVQEIGNHVGYEHHSHFSTAFKRRFGVSPLEYRTESIKE